MDLQQQGDLNIVLALGLLYLGWVGFRVDAGWLAATQARIEPWQRQMIVPIRQARDGWDGKNRKMAQAVLLEAERCLLALILQHLPSVEGTPGAELALANLKMLVVPPPELEEVLVGEGPGSAH